MPDNSRYKPFPLRQQVLGTVISVGAALLVMVLSQSIVWGFVTFFVLSIGVNAFMLWVRERRK